MIVDLQLPCCIAKLRIDLNQRWLCHAARCQQLQIQTGQAQTLRAQVQLPFNATWQRQGISAAFATRQDQFARTLPNRTLRFMQLHLPLCGMRQTCAQPLRGPMHQQGGQCAHADARPCPSPA